MNNLPAIQGFAWRHIQPTDGPLLTQFEQACALVDGATNLKRPEAWESLAAEENIYSRSLISVNDQGKIAIIGWFDIDERVEQILAFLEGRVHPEYRGRGFGTLLLDWLETNAASEVKAETCQRPFIYRIMFYDRSPDASMLFDKRGYTLLYVEQEMQRDLSIPLPKAHHQELSFETWTIENKSDFYAVYQAAFQTRTKTLMSAESWHHHFANPTQDDFQPVFSMLARKSGDPVAFVVVHSEKSSNYSGIKSAWITQTGVDSNFRRAGIGSALLSETMQQLQNAGYDWVKLSVNTDNPGAISLYNHLGFSSSKRLTMYHQALKK